MEDKYHIASPVVIMPQVYILPISCKFEWCKLTEVCERVPELAKMAQMKNKFEPTPEELVGKFAALVRQNTFPELGKKIFRYSLGSGLFIGGREVPTKEGEAPPYVPFSLNLSASHMRSLFVLKDWAIDTLKAIRRGAVAAADFGNERVGIPHQGKSFPL